jgi:hypothetical protein
MDVIILSVEEMYTQITQEDVDRLKKEATVQSGLLIPFVESVMPRTTLLQPVVKYGGLNIICLPVKKVKNEEEAIRYGLEPLKSSKIITDKDAKRIIEWFHCVCSVLHRDKTSPVRLDLMVGGSCYQLLTSCDGIHRQLNVLNSP